MLLHLLYGDSANGGELSGWIERQMIAGNECFDDPGARIEGAHDEQLKMKFVEQLANSPKGIFPRWAIGSEPVFETALEPSPKVPDVWLCCMCRTNRNV